jgi:phosphomannomutase
MTATATTTTTAASMRQLKIGTSSVRGVVGEALTPELIVNFACAFGTWCDGRAVVIGRDTRGSSSMLRAAVVSGLLATGCEVIDLGVASTPLVSFAVRELGADGGLSITGSHNDSEWNALKFIGPDGALLNAVKTEELLDIYHAGRVRLVGWDQLRPVVADVAVAPRYLENLLAAVDGDAIRRRGFAVAVDFCSGPVATLARPFLDALGCRVIPFNEEPTGRFPHAPAPSAANMRALADDTRRAHADLGAAINIDGDRIAFTTGLGTALSEEYGLPLAAAARLRRRPGLVVTNLSTSRMVDAVAEGVGQRVVRAAVGESHVIDQGLAEGAVLAGEGNGAVAALPATMTFDALLTLGLVLEEMAVRGRSLAQLVDELPRLSMRKRELPCPPNVVHRVVESFRTRHADRAPDCTDGVRVSWPDGWLHVRASNTEPLLRVIAEATSAERAAALLDGAIEHATGAIDHPGTGA